jgi:hypothetical protein
VLPSPYCSTLTAHRSLAPHRSHLTTSSPPSPHAHPQAALRIELFDYNGSSYCDFLGEAHIGGETLGGLLESGVGVTETGSWPLVAHMEVECDMDDPAAGDGCGEGGPDRPVADARDPPGLSAAPAVAGVGPRPASRSAGGKSSVPPPLTRGVSHKGPPPPNSSSQSAHSRGSPGSPSSPTSHRREHLARRGFIHGFCQYENTYVQGRVCLALQLLPGGEAAAAASGKFGTTVLTRTFVDVTVVACKNLANADRGKDVSDPYVSINKNNSFVGNTKVCSSRSFGHSSSVT